MRKLTCDRCGRDFWAPTKFKNQDPTCPRCGYPIGGDRRIAPAPPSQAAEPPPEHVYSEQSRQPRARIELENFPSVTFEQARDKVAGFLRELQIGFTGFKSIPSINPDLQMAQVNLDIGGIRMEIMIGQSLMEGQLRTDVMLSAFVCPIPEKKSFSFFRQLMSWNNFATDVSHFTVNEGHNAIYLVCRHPVWALGYDEFRYLIESIVKVAMNSVVQLDSEYEFGP